MGEIIAGATSFGRLTAIKPAALAGKRHGRWRFVCSCGTIKDIRADHVRAGAIRSCGCLERENRNFYQRQHNHFASILGSKHGQCYSRTYQSWMKMKARCNNSEARAFRWYGARGIKVCDRWNKSFEAFLADMGPRPVGKSIDRINNDGNYEPGNCRWATQKEQLANRRPLLRDALGHWLSGC
jgi:hypothetical protein